MTDMPHSAPKMSAPYSLPGCVFRLATDDPALLRRVDTIFGEFGCDRLPVSAVDEYRISPDGTSYRLDRNGDLLARFAVREAAVEHLEWHVTRTALATVKHSVALHAAGVARGGQALLLVGPSGIGKSTLTMCLLRQGLSYLSDEAVLVSIATQEVEAFPRAIGLERSGSTMIEFPATGNSHDTQYGKRYVRPSDFGASVPTVPLKVAAIVLLRDPAGVTELTRIGQGEALPYLVRQVFATGPADVVFETLTQLVSKAAVYTLQAGDPDTAAPLLLRLLPSGSIQ